MKTPSRIVFWVAIGAVFLLSVLPSGQLPPDMFDWWDKAQHALSFLLLGSIGLWAYPPRAVFVALGLFGNGLGIEFAQAATGWRFGDWKDCLADAFGVSLAHIG